MSHFGVRARTLRTSVWRACAVACLAWWAAPVAAAPVVPSCTHEPWVELVFDGERWPQRLQADTLADLRAGLRLRNISICSAAEVSEGSTPAPVARALLHTTQSDRFVVTIEIQDAVTEKRVLRDVNLSRVSMDARGLTLAQAVDELLRASWIELTLHDEPKTGVPASPAVQEQLAEVAAPSHGSGVQRLQVLGARFAGEFYTGGLKLLGADAQVAFWVSEHLAVSVVLGMRAGLRERSANGTLEASAITAGTSVLVPLWPRASRYNLLMSLGGHMGELTLTGHGAATTRTQSRSVLLASLRFGVSGTWKLTDLLRVELAFGPGVAVRGVDATDTGDTVVNTRGIELHGALGIGGLF